MFQTAPSLGHKTKIKCLRVVFRRRGGGGPPIFRKNVSLKEGKVRIQNP